MAKNNKIKVNMCINNLEVGGAEKQFLYIYNYLSKFYDVNIFLTNKKGINYLNKDIKKKIKIGYLNYIFHLLKNRSNISLFFLPKSYISFGIISSLFPNLKKIMFRRSLNYYQSNFFFKHIEHMLHKKMHLICSNSFAAKKELIKMENVPEKKIFILKNYIDKKKYKYFKKIKINTKFTNFLCISNFINYKGHKLILDTFQNLKNQSNWNIYFLGKKKKF